MEIRNITIDLSTSESSIPVAGYEGDHNATEISITLPNDMLDGVDYYIVECVTHDRIKHFSDMLYQTEGVIKTLLPQGFMKAPLARSGILALQVVAYGTVNNAVIAIKHSRQFFLEVMPSVEGEECLDNNEISGIFQTLKETLEGVDQYKAEITPSIKNGYWYIGNNSTGTSASGNPGPAGPQGVQGPRGMSGKSAYQTAIEGGYSGSESEFSALLASIGDIGTLLDSINGEVV